jgi:vancomycin permeability regulator SanA
MAGRKRRSPIRAFARTFAGVAVFALVALMIANFIVLSTSHIITLGSFPYSPAVGVVFGAGLDEDGGPSAMLADRLDGGIALYKSRRVYSLLFTGDNGTVEHNELRPMLQYALKRGVPRSAITLDYAGFNTYDSCYRAIHIFHVHHAILVTQSFHLPRAMYLCHALGMERVEGSARPDWGVYDAHLMFDEGFVRETLARAKAVWQASVTRPVPAIL